MKPLLIIFICVISVPIFSQDKIIDSLKHALKIVKHDTTKCNILNELIEAEPDDAISTKYNQELLKLAEKNLTSNPTLETNYLKYLALSYNNIGYYADNINDNKKAIEYYNKSLTIQKQINHKKGMALTLNNLGAVYYKQGNILKTVDFYTTSFEILKELDDKNGMSLLLNNIGIIHLSQGNIQKALEYLEKSLKIIEQIGDKEKIARSMINIGNIYSNQGNSDQAILYFEKSYKIQGQLGDKKGMAYSLSNIGDVYNDRGYPAKALIYFERSLQLRKAINDREGIAYSYNDLGVVYGSAPLKNLEKALNYYKKCLEISETISNKKLIAISLNNIGSIYKAQNKNTLALNFTLKSMIICKEIGFPENIRSTARELSVIYKDLGNYKAALENYELYIQMRDSLSNQDTRKASIKSQLKYEYEKKAAADSVRVSEEKKLTTVKLKQEKTQRYYLYGGLGLTALFGIFMFNRFRITQKQKNVIQKQKTLVEHQKLLVDEKQKEILDSIRYAKRIQQSLLPTEKFIDRVLKNNKS